MSDVIVSNLAAELAKKTKSILVETLLPPHLFWLNKFVLPVYIVFCGVFAKISGRGIVVGSFSNISLLSLYFVGLILGNRCLAVLNHNHTTKNWFAMVAIWMLGSSGARVVAFDLPVENISGFAWKKPWFLRKVESVPHPVVPGLPRLKKNETGIIRVGVAGRIRKEKSHADSVDLIYRLRDFLLPKGYCVVPVLAAPKSAWNDLLADLQGWDFVDTSSYEQYINALRGLDIVVLLYSREAYELRPSGVASEAIAEGVFVVARDTPVIGRQLSYPVVVGYGIDDSISLDVIVPELWRSYESAQTGQLAEYVSARGIEAVAEMIIRSGAGGKK
jgi:glycosyltransferase involved in cell wall biosynthesis